MWPPLLPGYPDGTTRPGTLLIEGRDTEHEIRGAAARRDVVFDLAETG